MSSVLLHNAIRGRGGGKTWHDFALHNMRTVYSVNISVVTV